MIKGSFILKHPHVEAIFGRKETSPVKIGPRNGDFRKFKGPNIKCSHRDPQKEGISLPGTTSFDVFCINIRPGM